MTSDAQDNILLQIYYDYETIKSLKPALTLNPWAETEFLPFLSFFCREAYTVFHGLHLSAELPGTGAVFRKASEDSGILRDGYSKTKAWIARRYQTPLVYVDEAGKPAGGPWYEIASRKSRSEQEEWKRELWTALTSIGAAFSGIRREKTNASPPRRLRLSIREWKPRSKWTPVFGREEEDRALYLYLVHTLHAVRTVHKLFGAFEDRDNGWWLRLYYLASYYSLKGLLEVRKQLIREHLVTPAIAGYFRELHIKKDGLFNPRFRDCMLHYTMTDADGSGLILPECESLKKPLFGLVESCFDGLDYGELKEKLKEKLELAASVTEDWLGR